MLLLFSWIQLSLLCTITLAKFDIQAVKEWTQRKMFRGCCQKHPCMGNSCYISERKASGWQVLRQRCQSLYPNFPNSIDIFRVQDEDSLLTILRETHIGSSIDKPGPLTVWTGGIRCPKSSPEGTIFETRWISGNQPFPEWLEDKLRNASSSETEQEEKCQFLSVSTFSNSRDVQYKFEDQNARHVAICEFSLPGEEDTSTEYETTESTTTKKTTKTSTSMETTESTTSTKGTTRIKSKTLSPAEGKLGSISSSKATTPETMASTSSANYRYYCKGREALGMWWPDTDPDTSVNVSCPEGMIGYAHWKCDKNTLKFVPEKPHVEKCKHVWIRDLEEDVADGNDAVAISSQLAKETRNRSMSHGDITALVDLASKLLHLYFKQKGEEEYDISQEQQKPLPLVFTESMVASISNMLRLETKQAWEVLPEVHQTREATKILKIVTTIGSRLSCIRKSSHKLQFTVAEENIDLQTFILNTTDIKEDDRIVFPQETDGVKANSLISLPSNLKLKKWLSPCKNYNSAVGVVYKHVGDFLTSEQLSDSTTHVATKVISFSMSNNTESIDLPKGKEVSIVLQHVLQQNIRHKNLKNPRCVFWNFSKSTYGEWDRSGCDLVSSNETHTRCKCNHLTNFAVLMDINNNIQEDEILSMMTYVCCGVSSLTLALTLICFAFIRSLHGRRSIITGNLCLSLLVTNLLLIFGLEQTQNQVLCSIIAGLLHFWVLSAFCWMLVEGYHLYRMVILVFERSSNLSVKFYYIFAYGTPIIVVGVSAGIKHNDYVGTVYCWLSTKNGLMWSFVGPACAIILVNLVVFILTLRSASSVRVKREQSTMKKIKNWVKGSMSVMCLLGLTWSLGLFYIDKKFYGFSYIFTVLNGLQGVFIFLFHVLLNDKVNKSLFCWCKGTERERRQKFLNQTSSNRLQSRTSNRTSVNSTGCTSANFSATNSNSTRNSALPHTNLLTSKDSQKRINRTTNSASKSQRRVIYNKHKATHTVSENGLPKQKLTNYSKNRSQSLSDEKTKPISHIRNLPSSVDSSHMQHHGRRNQDKMFF